MFIIYSVVRAAGTLPDPATADPAVLRVWGLESAVAMVSLWAAASLCKRP